jgi:DNA-directed RNA polymerase subunit RPC12/RpoP
MIRSNNNRMTIKNLKDELNRTHKPIILSYDKDKIVEYECKWCNRIIRAKLSEDSIFCVHCQSEIYLDNNTHKALKSVKAHNTIDDSELWIFDQDHHRLEHRMTND